MGTDTEVLGRVFIISSLPNILYVGGRPIGAIDPRNLQHTLYREQNLYRQTPVLDFETSLYNWSGKQL